MENVLHTKYITMENVWSLNIYSGSWANIASPTKVEFLNIPTAKYATLSKLK